jgi:hypothetical protein
MDYAILEKLARRETGRVEAGLREQRPGRLVIAPAGLKYRQLLHAADLSAQTDTYLLEYDNYYKSAYGSIVGFLQYMFKLARLLPVCARVDFFLLSEAGVRASVMAAMVMARLLGIGVHFHDYRFRTERGEKLTRAIYPLCDRLELGDTAAVPDGAAIPSSITFRKEADDFEAYREFTKDRAVPRVVVYGDFESSRIISLVRRTHESIKQKYPRTEFVLAALTEQAEGPVDPDTFDGSVIMVAIDSEAGFRTCLAEADTVILLSPGGLNHSIMARARAAGFPIIVNGFDYPDMRPNIIRVDRGSYSGLADAVIRLVDDDEHYRSFAAK